MRNTLKILAIDDDPTVLAIVNARLGQKDGHQVFLASDVTNGLKIAQKKKPDVILLDWMMPEVSGLEALKWLKGDSRTTWIPVYMLTARNKMVDVERALALGASGYFTKPLDINQISVRLADSKVAA